MESLSILEVKRIIEDVKGEECDIEYAHYVDEVTTMLLEEVFLPLHLRGDNEARGGDIHQSK